MIKVIKFKKEHANDLGKLISTNVRTLLPRFYNKKVIDFLSGSMNSEYIVKKSETRNFYVAIENDKCVGIAGLEKNQIRTFYVDVNWLKTGIGRKLMKKVEAISRKENYESIKVRSSLYAVGFYEKMGFKRIKKIYRKFGNGLILEEVLMIKRI